MCVLHSDDKTEEDNGEAMDDDVTVSDGDVFDLQPASDVEPDDDVVDTDSDDTVLYSLSDGESSSSASVSHPLHFACFLHSEVHH